MTDLLQENLYYLKRNKEDIFEQISCYLETEQNKNCKLTTNKDGTYNLSYAFPDQIKLLYSDNEKDLEQDLEQELERWSKEYYNFKNEKYDVVMYGLGLSHHLAKMIELNPLFEFYIIEPEIDIFVEALKVINIDQLLQHPQIKLLVVGNGDEQLRNFHILLNTYSAYQKLDVFIPYYAQINMETIKQYYEYNYTYREINLIEISFERIFGTLPYRNSIKNLEHIQKDNSIAILKNAFEGCTSLIVGAGPSLELDVEIIKQNKDKVLIIAAGSSIQSLQYYGINPHLIVSMDPGEANARVFRNANTKGIPLVYVPQIHSEILLERGSNNIFSFFGNDPIIKYLLSDVNVDYAFQATNSVTGTAIQVAKYLGSNKILLTGQDLSFPNENYYAKGAKHISSDSLSSKVATSHLQVENVNGSLNQTNFSMKSALENIEALIESIDGVTFINTSSLGAKIKGTDYIPIKVALEDLEVSYNYNELDLILSQKGKQEHLNKFNLYEKVHLICDTCKELLDSCKDSLSLISRIEELSRKNPNKAMNMLAKLEQELSKVTDSDLFNTIIISWNRIDTKIYDQNVIKIEKEQTIIGKSKLLNEIVVPYIKVINQSISNLVDEFGKVKLKLVSS